MIKDTLLQFALQQVTDHPSQVVRSMQPYLKMPPQSLSGLYREGLEHLNTVLTSKNFSDISDIVSVKSSDEPQEFRDRRDFKITALALPKIHLENCYHFELDLRELKPGLIKGSREKFQITLSRCSDFVIRGGTVENARNVCLLDHCSNFQISQLTAKSSEGYGLIIFNSRYFLVEKCSFQNGLASGLYCLGNTAYGRIEHNSFTSSFGYFNWDAGLHINHCTPQLKVNDIPEKSHEPATILDKTLKPGFLYIQNNVFSGNRAQGIYCEGCTLSVIEDNIIEGNNKEGICFDWGSALNLFRNNSLSRNGERAALSEVEIKADFIEHHPLLADGSSSCKLPAISIDNGALNFIESNKVYGNFGGGVKMVRTGIANILHDNMIVDNGIGTNEYFKHFHGINLLGMGAGKSEFAPGDENLDFMPSAKNVISQNKFIGISQHHAIYAGPVCPDNIVLIGNTYLNNVAKPISDNLKIVKLAMK
jgi:parallel beta-helix repeat protein